MKERNNSCSTRIISKNSRDIVSRDASASTRTLKARGLFCPSLRSVAHYWRHGRKKIIKKLTLRIYTLWRIYYVYFIWQDKSRRRRRGGRCWPWIGSLIPSSSKHTLFHRSAALTCEIYARAREKVSERERERERDKTGKWEEKGNLKSLLLEREHSHDVKAKEGHTLHPSPLRRLLNVNAWDNF